MAFLHEKVFISRNSRIQLWKNGDVEDNFLPHLVRFVSGGDLQYIEDVLILIKYIFKKFLWELLWLFRPSICASKFFQTTLFDQFYLTTVSAMNLGKYAVLHIFKNEPL